MKVIRLTLVVGAVLFSATPVFPQLVKAALGFRLGISPNDRGHYKFALNNKALGVHLVSGVNTGQSRGWHGETMKTAGSAYGVGLGGRDQGPVSGHGGGGAVRHLKILGLNLYLGGRAAQLSNGLSWKPPLKKPYGHQPYHYPIHKPAAPGGGWKQPVAHASGQVTTAAGGVRANVGVPGYGLGFNLGYRQGFNTKSPLGYLFSLARGSPKYHAPLSHPVHKGQDQVYVQGSPLKGHGHDNGMSHSPMSHHELLKVPGAVGAHSPFLGFPQHLDSPAGLESKQHISTQQHPGPYPPPPQGRHHAPYPGPPPSRFPFFRFSRPSILRPTPIRYNFNSPQPLQSGPIQMVMAPHPPTPAPQHSRSSNPTEGSSQGWSTLYPVATNVPPVSRPNTFVNPIPENGQPLAKIQASLNNQVSSAQNQIPYIHHQHQHQQQPQQYQSFPAPSQGPYSQNFNSQPQNFNSQPQNFNSQPQNFNSQPQNFNSQPQNYNQHFPQSSNSPQESPEYNLFQQHIQTPHQPFQPSNTQSIQQSPFLNHISEQQTQSSPAQQPAGSQIQTQNIENFPSLPQIPFTADSMPFEPEPGFQYTHSTSSDPVNMGTYSMDMDLGSANSDNVGAQGPLFGPGGRRLKKKTRARQDIIIKKQDTVSKDMETSSSNVMTLASSLGATQWTPMQVVDPPVLTKKSLEMTPSSSPITKEKDHMVAEASAPVPTVITPEDHKQERTMILKKRRLNSGEVTAPTVLPTTISTTTSSTTTTTTTTSTPAPSPSTTTTTPAPSTSSSTTPAPESSVGTTTVSP